MNKQSRTMTFNEKELDTILNALEYYEFEENYSHNEYVKRSKKLINKIKDVLFPVEDLSNTLK